MPKIGTRGSVLIIRNARPPFQVVMRFPQDLLWGGAASKERKIAGKFGEKARGCLMRRASSMHGTARCHGNADSSRHPEALAKRASKGGGPDRAAHPSRAALILSHHPHPSRRPLSRAPQDEGDGRGTRPPQDDGQ